MRQDPITKEVSQRICNHMNKDHLESLKAYASFYGGIKNPINANLLEITAESMHLSVDGSYIIIKFDHPLKDSSDAHQTLVSMLEKIPQ